jgi:hypothetical protein
VSLCPQRSKVYAFDAKTGKQLWKFDPKVPGEWAVKVCCGLVNRATLQWNGKIFVGTLDGRLVAIDANIGKPCGNRKSSTGRVTPSPLRRAWSGQGFTDLRRRVRRAWLHRCSGCRAGKGLALLQCSRPRETAGKCGIGECRKTWGKGDWWNGGGGTAGRHGL